MPIDPSLEQGMFVPEATTAMSRAFEAACKELHDVGQLPLVRKVVAQRIIAAARRASLTRFAYGQRRWRDYRCQSFRAEVDYKLQATGRSGSLFAAATSPLGPAAPTGSWAAWARSSRPPQPLHASSETNVSAASSFVGLAAAVLLYLFAAATSRDFVLALAAAAMFFLGLQRMI
jgi:hypothetical protein